MCDAQDFAVHFPATGKGKGDRRVAEVRRGGGRGLPQAELAPDCLFCKEERPRSFSQSKESSFERCAIGKRCADVSLPLVREGGPRSGFSETLKIQVADAEFLAKSN